MLILSCFLCLLNDKKLDQMLKPAEELHVSYLVITCREKAVFVFQVMCQWALSGRVSDCKSRGPRFNCKRFLSLSHFAIGDLSAIFFLLAVSFLISWSETLALLFGLCSSPS